MSEENVVGSAYVEIRPHASSFAASLDSAIGPALARGGAVPVTASTAGFESSLSPVRNSLSQLRGLAEIAIGGGITAGVIEGISAAANSAVYAQKLETLLGPQAEVFNSFIEQNRAALVSTVGELNATGAALAGTLQNAGITDPTKLEDATQRFTAMAAELAALNPDAGGVRGITTALDRAFATGAAPRGLPELHFSQQDVKDAAKSLGFGKADQDAITASRDKVEALQHTIAAFGQKTPDQLARVREATNSLREAQAKHAAAVKDYGSTAPAKYYDDVEKAQNALTRAQEAGTVSIDDRKKAQDELTAAQKAYNAAADPSVNLTSLTPDQLTQSVAQVLQTKKAQIDKEFAEAGASGALAFAQAGSNIKQGFEDIGASFLKSAKPQIDAFNNFLTSNPGVFKEIGKDIGIAFGVLGNTVGFIVEHKTEFEIIAAAFAADKVIGWGAAVAKEVGNLGGAGGLAKKMFPNISSLGAKPSDGVAATTTIGEMSVGTLIVRSMIGGGVGGSPVAAGSAAEGEAIAAGEGVALGSAAGRTIGSTLATFGLGALIAAQIIVPLNDYLKSKGAADLLSGSSYSDFAHGATTGDHSGGKGGLSGFAENQAYYATVPSWLGGNSKEDFYKNLANAFGSSQLINDVKGGNANDIGTTASILSATGLGDSDPLVQKYHDLAQLVADGTVRTEGDLALFNDNWATVAAKSNDTVAQITLLNASIEGTRRMVSDVQAEFDQLLTVRKPSDLAAAQQRSNALGGGMTVNINGMTDPRAILAEIIRHQDAGLLANAGGYQLPVSTPPLFGFGGGA